MTHFSGLLDDTDRLAAIIIDIAYSAYDEHPLSEADERGDLASFREAAGAS